MEAFDEKLAVYGLVGGLRGACSHTGGGPATQLFHGPATTRHRAAPGATCAQPQHVPCGACDQSSATADAEQLRLSADGGAARVAAAEPFGADARRGSHRP